MSTPDTFARGARVAAQWGGARGSWRGRWRSRPRSRRGSFSVHEYEHDSAAELTGSKRRSGSARSRAVFKTLVVDLDRSWVAVVRSRRSSTSSSFGKRAAIATRPGRRATGYVARRHLASRPAPAAADDARRIGLDHETIHVSAGRRGLELELEPSELVRLTGAGGGGGRPRQLTLTEADEGGGGPA